MARPLRSTFGYGFWHITSRGVDGRAIFMDDDDRLLFLALLVRTIERFGWRCHAYCLMGNHFHLVIECGQPALSDGMERLNGLYASSFNHRYGRAGHLFQRRFESKAIADERYLATVCDYVWANPVRVGLCAHRRDWRWGGLGVPRRRPVRSGRPRAAAPSRVVRRVRRPRSCASAPRRGSARSRARTRSFRQRARAPRPPPRGRSA